MKISITSTTLASLLTGYFSYEACMALEDLFERLEEEEGASYQAPAPWRHHRQLCRSQEGRR